MMGSRSTPGVFRLKHACAAALVSVALMPLGTVAQPVQLPFSALPADVVDTVRQIRQACEQAGYASSDEAGISFVDLDHTGGTDIILSAQHVCDGMVKGANCSTGGCDLIIWKQVGSREWRRIFDEIVAPDPLIATDSQNRFGGLIVPLYVGINGKSPYCSLHVRGKFCGAMLVRRNGKWLARRQ
ncbi:hypothetical protein [Xanthobacter wiegelii]|uniref:hypothetical protein n=1 Tax=Xanthobacter wiegelii TaxID=3119913 RepID=UPI0037292918